MPAVPGPAGGPLEGPGCPWLLRLGLPVPLLPAGPDLLRPGHGAAAARVRRPAGAGDPPRRDEEARSVQRPPSGEPAPAGARPPDRPLRRAGAIRRPPASRG